MASKAGSDVGAHDATVEYDMVNQTMVVTHADTGEPLLNPQTGDPIVQEDPHVEAQQELDNARKAVEKAQDQLAQAEARLADAEEAFVLADARWDEIVADLTARYGGTD